MSWTESSPGVLRLPGGGMIRGRSLRADLGPADLTLVLGHGSPPAWTHRRLRWPDFWVPLDRAEALAALASAYAAVRRGERVEVACRGGVGRTGTALAALVVLDGLTSRDAVEWVRARYDRRAVETPWQRRWLRHVRPEAPRPGP